MAEFHFSLFLRVLAFVLLAFGGLSFKVMPVQAQPIPPGTVDITENISITRHNLSTTGGGAVKSSTESEICVFCHTPHGVSTTGTGIGAPMWNRNLPYQDSAGYTLYDQVWSFSFEGQIDPVPGNRPTGYSRLCLSCHDGVIAIGSVINRSGSGGYGGQTPTVDTLGVGAMPGGPGPGGALGGDTRLLGINLQNDHPVSFIFDTALAALDTELTDPGAPPAGLNDVTPLAPAGGYKTGAKRYFGDAVGVINQVQCTSCHNPHAVTYPKFLRAPRLQNATETAYLPGGAGSAPAGQIICLYCHTKPGWVGSTHDVDRALRSAYPAVDNPATQHPENYNFDGQHTVGEYACRSCHDPHTAQGAKRLHREGVSGFGGSEAAENTCYLCHSPNTTALSTLFLPAGDPTSGGNPRFQATGARIAPDIWSQFNKDQNACLGGGGLNPNGSAMCMQLATGHEPVFVARSQEGVQVKSAGIALTPALNEETPGILTADDRHVECVDCHNPHQVNSPVFLSLAFNGADPPNAKGGRFKGMKGVGIDVTGSRPIVVGRFGMSETDLYGNSANRDPYVYEICFRCHGNSVPNIFTNDRNPEDPVTLAVPAGYSSYTSMFFSPRTDPTNAPASDARLSFKGFSNKFREFNPFTDDVESPAMLAVDFARFGQFVPSHSQQINNPAYHPVAKPGRNGSIQLCNQLKFAFNLNCGSAGAASISLGNLTIQCVDCHNSDKYDAFKNAYSGAAVGEPLLLGPLTESNLRSTDVDPQLHLVVDYTTGRPVETGLYPSGPIGPHGSRHRRLLRANYDTDILKPARCFAVGNPSAACTTTTADGFDTVGGHQGGGGASRDSHFQKFLLCFQCHDRAAFDPDITAQYDGTVTTIATDRSLTRFFGISSDAGVDSWWEGNLHMYHLRWSGAMCHECHYNVHSNVEALNTVYGDGKGGALPADPVDGITDGVIGTHLINFAPTVEGTVGLKPIWFYDGTAFRCYLRCHNEVMNSCAYQAPGSGTPNARWCAGGRNPGTAG